MNVGVSDKILMPWLEGKNYITAADEGEAMAIGAGYWLATGERANVFMSADGFCNALNPFTSWIIPDGIEMNIIISTGRQEDHHKIMSDILEDIIKMTNYDPGRVDFQYIRKQ